MKRLYYVADDLQTTKEVSDALHAAGVTDWHFHVISKDEAGLYRHHIHSATYLQELDVLHTGARWAILGALLGFAGSTVAMFADLLPFQMTWWAVLVVTVVFAGFAAWQGGMLGLTRENYKIAPYHHHIENGKYLIMVDVRGELEHKVRPMLNLRFHSLQQVGTDSTLMNPLAQPRRVFHQNTH